MHFTAEGWVLIIGAIALAATNIIAAWRTGGKVDRVDRKADEARAIANQKLNDVHTQTQIIEKLGNSAAARAQAQIEALTAENAFLRTTAATQATTAAMRAASKSPDAA